MSIIRVRCVDQTMRASIVPLVASGGVNVDTMAFSFCTAWAGYESKTAVFYRDPSTVYHVLISDDNTCTVPSEVVAEPGVFYFGVMGTKDTKVLTTEVLSYPVAQGALTKGTAPADPTPSIYAQLLDAIAALGIGLPTPSEADAGKSLIAGAHGTASWQNPATDATLSQRGRAADAGAVGTALATAEAEFSRVWTQVSLNAQNVERLQAAMDEQPTSIDLTAFETDGRIVETYADGTQVAYSMTFNEDGNPVRIADSKGNITTLTW